MGFQIVSEENHQSPKRKKGEFHLGEERTARSLHSSASRTYVRVKRKKFHNQPFSKKKKGKKKQTSIAEEGGGEEGRLQGASEGNFTPPMSRRKRKEVERVTLLKKKREEGHLTTNRA